MPRHSRLSAFSFLASVLSLGAAAGARGLRTELSMGAASVCFSNPEGEHVLTLASSDVVETTQSRMDAAAGAIERLCVNQLSKMDACLPFSGPFNQSMLCPSGSVDHDPFFKLQMNELAMTPKMENCALESILNSCDAQDDAQRKLDLEIAIPVIILLVIVLGGVFICMARRSGRDPGYDPFANACPSLSCRFFSSTPAERAERVPLRGADHAINAVPDDVRIAPVVN